MQIAIDQFYYMEVLYGWNCLFVKLKGIAFKNVTSLYGHRPNSFLYYTLFTFKKVLNFIIVY